MTLSRTACPNCGSAVLYATAIPANGGLNGISLLPGLARLFRTNDDQPSSFVPIADSHVYSRVSTSAREWLRVTGGDVSKTFPN